MAPEISLLVVSWRTHDLLARLLDSILDAKTSRTFEVIVVDNASGDGTAEMVRGRLDDPRLRLIANDYNAGFARANNQAVALASGHVLGVVNPDIVLSWPVVETLVDHLEAHPDVGLVSCTLVDEDGTSQTIHRSFPTLPTVFFVHTYTGRRLDYRLLGKRFRRHYRLLDRPRQGIISIDQVAGALEFLSRETFDRLGRRLFDDDLPILVNDVDLSRRVHDLGLAVDLFVGTQITHSGGGSLKQLDPVVLEREKWDGLRSYYAAHESRWRRLVLASLVPPRVRRLVPSRRLPSELTDAKPLVTIAIPCFNYGEFLGEAIESALGQTYPNLEILVVDDGSTDDSPEVARRYAPEVLYRRTENQGLSSTRNTAATVARGELIVFLDADNRLAPTFVEETVTTLVANPAAAFVYTQRTLFGDRDAVTETPSYDAERLKSGNYIDAGALLRTEHVRRFPYDETNRIGWEDWDFYLTLAEKGLQGQLLDRPLVDYRVHGENMTSDIQALRKRRLRAQVLRRHTRFVGLDRVLAAEWSAFRLRVGLARRRWRGGARA